MNHLLSIYDLSCPEIDNIFSRAARLKDLLKKREAYLPLQGMTLGMIFDKASTRTRISFEVGMYQLGGMPIFLSSRDTQLGRGEAIADTARIMSRFAAPMICNARHRTIPRCEFSPRPGWVGRG
jgi:ornithine carbamoyltransferase